MVRKHNYSLTIKWTGNTGTGTSNYRSYQRMHSILAENKPEILASSDPAFRGDPTKHSPEELFVASISQCHMLWYLHLCADAGVVVTDYIDNAIATMVENAEGSGKFVEVILRPLVNVTEESMIGLANDLHEKANKMCFIANSINFKVRHEPEILCSAVNNRQAYS